MNRSESKYFNTAIKMNKALISILENKDFEFITVKEICEKAQVNRSTFYLHYENTADLLEETTRYLLDNFLSYFDEDATNKINYFRTCPLSELNFVTSEYLEPYLTSIKDNKKVFSIAMSRSQAFGFVNIYKRMFRYIFDPILDRFHYPADSRKYVMMFYLNGIMAIINEWLKDDCDKTISEISKIISDCIFGRLADFSSNLEILKEKGIASV